MLIIILLKVVENVNKDKMTFVNSNARMKNVYKSAIWKPHPYFSYLVGTITLEMELL